MLFLLFTRQELWTINEINDFKGASSTAMKNIWFNPNNEPRKEDIKPTYTAGSYDDILHFLRGFS
ncbi:hypothetical protein FE410_04105 [Leuconostoc carnosum]|nr:hypothetical protein FE410_04105 [Leuconostoc carnosum]